VDRGGVGKWSEGDERGMMLVADMCYLVKPDEKSVETRVGTWLVG
jgi:hypothetical protein